MLSAPREAVLADNFADGLVTDDDPEPRFTIGSAVAVEGSRVIRFPVTVSHPSDKYIRVTVTMRSGTAVLDGQGAWENEADVSVDLRRTRTELEVELLNDKIKEGAETFTVKVKEAESATLDGRGTVIGAIRDDDQR